MFDPEVPNSKHDIITDHENTGSHTRKIMRCTLGPGLPSVVSPLDMGKSTSATNLYDTIKVSVAINNEGWIVLCNPMSIMT